VCQKSFGLIIFAAPSRTPNSRQCGPRMARLPGFSQLVHCSEDGIDEALKGLEVPDAKWLGETTAWLGKGFR